MLFELHKQNTINPFEYLCTDTDTDTDIETERGNSRSIQISEIFQRMRFAREICVLCVYACGSSFDDYFLSIIIIIIII